MRDEDRHLLGTDWLQDSSLSGHLSMSLVLTVCGMRCAKKMRGV